MDETNNTEKVEDTEKTENTENVEDVEKTENVENVESSDKKDNKTLMFALLSVGAVLVIVATVISTMVFVKNVKRILGHSDRSASSEATTEENSSDELGGSGDTIEIVDSIDEDTDDTDSDEEADTIVERDPEYFDCVPADEMYLRKTPGLGDDKLSVINAGTIVEWRGEEAEVKGVIFYKVKVYPSEMEGYVSERYLVKHENDYDMSRLNVVDTSSPLYTYEMMVDDIYELSGKYSGIVSYEIIGNSVCGRDIYAVTLGGANVKNHVMIQASIHGREYMNTQLVMKLIEYYAANYYDLSLRGRTYKDLFNETAFHVIPMVNPDGVTISQFGVEALGNDELYLQAQNSYILDAPYLVQNVVDAEEGVTEWQDNYLVPGFVRPANAPLITFEEYQRIWKANGRGVDLNNNFDADWNGIMLKAYPCYGSYKGAYPESEPETQALVNYAQKYDFACYLSYHSRGQIIYYDCKGNSQEFSDREASFAENVESVIKYRKRATVKDKHVNMGGFGDWIQLKLKKLSVTIESGRDACPLPIEEFDSIFLRHRELWSNLADF